MRLSLLQPIWVIKKSKSPLTVATIAHLESEYNGSSAAIIQDSIGRMYDFVSVEFIHENRDLNVEAHTLSNAAITLSFGRHVWLPILPDIICIPEVISS